MIDQVQSERLSSIKDVEVFCVLIGDLYDDMAGKVARFRQLALPFNRRPSQPISPRLHGDSIARLTGFRLGD